MTTQRNQHHPSEDGESGNATPPSTKRFSRQNPPPSWQAIHFVAIIAMSCLACIALIGGFLTKEMQPFLTIFSFLSGAMAGLFTRPGR